MHETADQPHDQERPQTRNCPSDPCLVDYRHGRAFSPIPKDGVQHLWGSGLLRVLRVLGVGFRVSLWYFGRVSGLGLRSDSLLSHVLLTQTGTATLELEEKRVRNRKTLNQQP